MQGFHGEYEATVDAKGRFLLPGGLKKQLPEGEGRFILSRGFEKCLTLYPWKSWEVIITKIAQLNDFDPNNLEVAQKYYSDQDANFSSQVVGGMLNNSSNPKENVAFVPDAKEILRFKVKSEKNTTNPNFYLKICFIIFDCSFVYFSTIRK